MLSQVSSRAYVEASLLKLRIKEVLVKCLHADEDGAVMTEYALLIAGISVTLVAAIAAFYLALTELFTERAGFINNAGN